MIKEKDMLEKLLRVRVLAKNIKRLLRLLAPYISKVREDTMVAAQGQLFRNSIFLFYI
jgi:hypothetical protein